MAKKSTDANIDIDIIDCPNCGVLFGIPPGFEYRRRADGRLFYCPNGHSMSYGKGEADKLREQIEEERRKRQIAEQQIARWQDYENEARTARKLAERKAAAAKGQVTRLKNRARAGLCPCCNRSFVNLQRHMGTKHPGFVTEPQDSEHVH